ncbi:MAG TPA: SgcJ/EcaC family oxidoreductase [Acidimicrobiales bacterium]|jgi:steroid delta-isomerase|nr:SgcJ/EcaC family oxidoreductase [Acidimicrobiales bacterium]
MPTANELRTVITTYVAALNSRDPDVIAALFAEDAVQADPASSPPNVGRDAIRAFFTASIGGSEGWTFSASSVHTCADHVAFNFEIAVKGDGSTMTIGGIEVFVVNDEGLISSVNAYWDEADLAVS